MQFNKLRKIVRACSSGKAETHDRVAVSLTPLALEADSRAFKVAASLARFGYRSIVLEGCNSAVDFSKYGLEVHSLASGRSKVASQYNSSHGLLGERRGAISQFLRFGWFWTKFARRYVLVPLLRLPRADLYYVHSYEYLPVVLTVRKKKARVVYDAHDFYRGILPSESHSEFMRRYVLPWLGRIEAVAARRCDAVVTVSHGVAEAIAESIGVKVRVMSNAVDRRANILLQRDIRARLNLSQDELLLVMVGNNKPGLPLDFVSSMLANLSQHVHIAFLGRGYDGFENQTAGRADRRLHFIPPVPSVEVTSFISSAAAGLLIYRTISRNYQNALPNGFFHLLDAGLPIARFPLAEVERAIGGEPVGPLLDPFDPAQAAKVLIDFLNDSTARRIAASTARALGDRMTWVAQEDRLRDIVESQASGR